MDDVFEWLRSDLDRAVRERDKAIEDRRVAVWLLAEACWERDQARIAATARRAERDVARAERDHLEADDRFVAWAAVSRHKAFDGCGGDGKLLDHMIGRLDDLLAEHEASDVASFLAEVTEREPWRVLREAERLIRGHWNFDGVDSGRLLQLAEELESEARRDTLVQLAISAYDRAVNAIEADPEGIAAAVDAVLAEVAE